MAFTRQGVTYAVPQITGSVTAAEGSLTSAIRSDAVVAWFDAAVPSTASAGASAATGSAAFSSRRDHIHGMPSSFTTFEAPNLTLGTANSEGSGNSIRSGGTLLAFDATLPDAITFSQSGSAGSATVAARRDHAHAMVDTPFPSGMLAWHKTACPTGWSEVTAARGRYIVGTPSGGTDEAVVGTALTNSEDRAVGQHTHTVTDPGHAHDKGATNAANPGASYAAAGSNNNNGTLNGDTDTTGITLANAGSVASTNAPYIQYTLCEKD